MSNSFESRRKKIPKSEQSREDSNKIIANRFSHVLYRNVAIECRKENNFVDEECINVFFSRLIESKEKFQAKVLGSGGLLFL